MSLKSLFHKKDSKKREKEYAERFEKSTNYMLKILDIDECDMDEVDVGEFGLRDAMEDLIIKDVTLEENYEKTENYKYFLERLLLRFSKKYLEYILENYGDSEQFKVKKKAFLNVLFTFCMKHGITFYDMFFDIIRLEYLKGDTIIGIDWSFKDFEMIWSYYSRNDSDRVITEEIFWGMIENVWEDNFERLLFNASQEDIKYLNSFESRERLSYCWYDNIEKVLDENTFDFDGIDFYLEDLACSIAKYYPTLAAKAYECAFRFWMEYNTHYGSCETSQISLVRMLEEMAGLYESQGCYFNIPEDEYISLLNICFGIKDEELYESLIKCLVKLNISADKINDVIYKIVSTYLNDFENHGGDAMLITHIINMLPNRTVYDYICEFKPEILGLYD